MEVLEDREAGIIVVGLRRGEKLLESLREVARAVDIHSGVVMSGIGSLSRGSIHIVSSNDYPPENTFYDLDGPLEVVNFGGIIAAHDPHIHIGIWDAEKRYWGGHLEEGCEVLALAEIAIRRLPSLRLTRRPMDETGIMMLMGE